MKTVGIIGYGSFGAFLADKLHKHVTVLVYDETAENSPWSVSLDLAVNADYLILCIPLGSYVQFLNSIKNKINNNTTIVDVCSVKEESIKMIKNILPKQKVVATHPLFGPESAKDSLKGQMLVMCPEVSDVAQYKIVHSFANKIGLNVMELTCKEHDEQIAVVQGLTFFIAKALQNMGIENSKLQTPSFKRLLHLAELERHHSQQLFNTIQNGNKYTKKVRQKFIDISKKIDAELH